MKTLDDWLLHIEQLHSKPIDMGLERMQQMLKTMNIHFDCPVYLVGGTNGKGSVCTYLEQMLLDAGYKVCVHTSPHLLRFNERARINAHYAEDEALCRNFAAVEAARGEMTLSYFEYTLLGILKLFQEEKPDAVVLEIGLGGRLDAVNTVEPTVSIITSVGIDHTAFLGDTREAIGLEKAHIFRSRKVAICADTDPPQTVIDYARKIKAYYNQAGCDFKATKTSESDWCYESACEKLEHLPLPAMLGIYQINNAAAAIRALQATQCFLPIKHSNIINGLKNARLTGRFQKVSEVPEILADVGHNPHAALQLAKTLDETRGDKQTIAVFGMLADKDRESVCKIMAHSCDEWFVADLHGPRGGKAGELAAYLQAAGVDSSRIHCYATVAEALQNAQSHANNPVRIIAFGSFLTVSEVLASLGVPVL